MRQDFLRMERLHAPEYELITPAGRVMHPRFIGAAGSVPSTWASASGLAVAHPDQR